uniref:Putative transcription factor e2f7 panstrongylus lignarius n=1 Tax=Rhodnius prolixus TaxID=13249 RepID=A0A4P6D7S8_RHOPR
MDRPEFCSPPKRTILGNLNQNGGSPVSPMANLKLLTKVATSHFSVGENTEYDGERLENRDIRIDSKPSRRLRSLSFICKKFLLLYKLDIPVGEYQQISLGNLALSLGIEKRRVYDIINVVSSLHMAVKVCKDKYTWYGNQNLTRLLTQLKAYTLINKFDEQISAVLQNQLTPCESKESDSAYIKITRGDRSVFEENRIGILCQKFIMLFLVCNDDVALNMCTISKLILTGDVQEKTGMRRLYDIANVLEALDLIRRYHYKVMKKPAFKYCGPTIDVDRSDCEKLMPERLPCMGACEASDLGDTNSDSSVDVPPTVSKLNSILEVVCTEIEEENCRTLSSPITSIKRKSTDLNRTHCNAKKQLFPSPFVVKSVGTVNSFIKAPKHSFRLECNELQIKENSALPLNNNDCSTNNQNVPVTTVIQMQPMFNRARRYSNFRTSFSKLARLEENNREYGDDAQLRTDWNAHQSFSINDDSSNESLKLIPSEMKISEIQSNNNKIVLNKLSNFAQSIAPTKIKVIRPTKISDIQNGGVYKVLKKGNTVQLYAL